jgi:hypothetical protein
MTFRDTIATHGEAAPALLSVLWWDNQSSWEKASSTPGRPQAGLGGWT